MFVFHIVLTLNSHTLCKQTDCALWIGSDVLVLLFYVTFIITFNYILLVGGYKSYYTHYLTILQILHQFVSAYHMVGIVNW